MNTASLDILLTYGSLFMSAGFFFFGVWLALAERHDLKRRAFAALVITAGACVLTFVMWRLAVSDDAVLLWTRLMYVAGASLSAALLGLGTASLDRSVVPLDLGGGRFDNGRFPIRMGWAWRRSCRVGRIRRGF